MHTTHTEMVLTSVYTISMGTKKDVTPLLAYWSYVSLALPHRYVTLVAGLLKDVTHSYDMSFLFGGLLVIFPAAVFFITMIYHRRNVSRGGDHIAAWWMETFARDPQRTGSGSNSTSCDISAMELSERQICYFFVFWSSHMSVVSLAVCEKRKYP